MLGAIVGDIIGSVREFNNVKSTNFHLFTPGSKFTDDTVMTLAVAKWLTVDRGHTREGLVQCMQETGRKYPYAGYGQKFFRWLLHDDLKPYGSMGNGSAMRVSPVALYAISKSDHEILGKLSELSAVVSHNSHEAIVGALAIADSIWLAGQKSDKDDIRRYIEDRYHYDLHHTVDEIRPEYKHSELCRDTVPQALMAFLDGNSFEEVIRLAVSLGGDSDTIADMAGSIADACYGIPENMAGICYGILTPELRKILDDFETLIGKPVSDPFYLQRFLDAQRLGYLEAYKEMQRGRKTSHWIWYVFPQLRGFGHSSNSWYYGLADKDEAKAYLEHPILGKRLREITSAVLQHSSTDAVTLMGSHIDTIKLRSCMTLFDAIAPNDVFAKVLDSSYEGKRDEQTLTKLQQPKR